MCVKNYEPYLEEAFESIKEKTSPMERVEIMFENCGRRHSSTHTRAVKPVVTMGVCVRNNASTLSEAIGSIVNQDFPHGLMEVIFVDDGSKDDTLSIIREFVSKMDIPAKVLSTKWQGLGTTRNLVVENCEGKYIVWVDGDMILPRNHVRKQVEFMEQNPKVGIAKAKYAMLSEDNIVATLENIPFLIEDSKGGRIINLKLPGTGGSIYRVKAIRQVDGFDSNLKGVGEDQEAAYRIRAIGWVICRSPAVFYERRVKTWKDLWNKHLWYGYGNYHLYRKNRNIFSLFKMVPIAGFLVGVLGTLYAYRLTRRKSVFLLPFHFAFKTTAWCLGFARGKADSSYHHNENYLHLSKING